MQMNNTIRSIMMAVALLLVYLLFKNNNAIHNEGSLDDSLTSVVEDSVPDATNQVANTAEYDYGDRMQAAQEQEQEQEQEQFEPDQDGSNEILAVPTQDEEQYFEQRDYTPPEDIYLKGKFNRRNKSSRSQRNVNYKDARRGDFGKDAWSNFLDKHNNILSDGQKGSNNQFAPVDESGGQLAVFKDSGKKKCDSGQDCNPEDLFDVNKYLPQEVNDDWFEVQPEAVSVKNRHLINVTKPIGINTIGTSLRNSSYDVRGTPACPKFVVSPWLQSSIEPDSSLKSIV
jgi:hypothetical protein